MPSNPLPSPGSPAGAAQGCTCVRDNHYGIDGGRPGEYVRTVGCPVHDAPAMTHPDLPAIAAAVRDGHAPTLAQARVLLARVAELEELESRLRTVIGSTLSSDRRRVELAEQVLAAVAPIPDAGGGKA